MRPMTREEVRGAFVNPDPTAKKIRLPAWFDDVPWRQIDYLGWRDLRAPQLAYLVTEADDQALGVLLRQAPNRAELESRAVMCDLCRSSRRQRGFAVHRSTPLARQARMPQRVRSSPVHRSRLCGQGERQADPPRLRS